LTHWRNERSNFSRDYHRASEKKFPYMLQSTMTEEQKQEKKRDYDAYWAKYEEYNKRCDELRKERSKVKREQKKK